jgi:sugar O-acyltransferase (sialic acid O-acetyltransferase NeuD family)
MTLSSSSRERPIYLLGCGGHGRVVLDCLLMCGKPVAGIVDAALARGSLVDGVPVLGGDECLGRLDPQIVSVCLGVGVMPGESRRAELFDNCKISGFQFVSIFHPSATISSRHEFGVGIQVLAGAVVQVGVRLGDNVIINTRASVDHDCMIEKDVMIGPGAVICGQVSIGAGAYVGAGAVILPGVSLGPQAIVGAGSIVIKDVATGEKVVGNPAAQYDLAGMKNA